MWAIDDAIAYTESLDDNSFSTRAAELQAKTERELKAYLADRYRVYG